MGKIKKAKRGLSAFIASDNGQRFFNFAYSIGAAIVILGALFKILHLPGGNFLLSLGMGTEVFMFILTAFDRPEESYDWSLVYPQLRLKKNSEETAEAVEPADLPDAAQAAAGAPVAAGSQGVSGTVIINGGGTATLTPALPHAAGICTPAPNATGDFVAPVITANATSGEILEQVGDATQLYLNQITEMTNELRHLHETTSALNRVSDTLLESYRAITENSNDISASSRGYVEQMQDLNRNISGLNTIYEIQLKGVASQLDAIDRVNRGIKDIRDMYEKSASTSARYCEETEKMARYMQQLNAVYEKMITAMTINMYRPMMGADPVTPPPAPEQ